MLFAAQPTLQLGILVVAALPGAVLPGDFAIGARETYGKTSNGMILFST